MRHFTSLEACLKNVREEMYGEKKLAKTPKPSKWRRNLAIGGAALGIAGAALGAYGIYHGHQRWHAQNREFRQFNEDRRRHREAMDRVQRGGRP